VISYVLRGDGFKLGILTKRVTFLTRFADRKNFYFLIFHVEIS